jgi:hypothetical protein
MKHAVVGLVALGSVALLAAPAAGQFKGPKGGGKTGWLSSLAEGKSQARASGKPLMVVIRCVP